MIYKFFYSFLVSIYFSSFLFGMIQETKKSKVPVPTLNELATRKTAQFLLDAPEDALRSSIAKLNYDVKEQVRRELIHQNLDLLLNSSSKIVSLDTAPIVKTKFIDEKYLLLRNGSEYIRCYELPDLTKVSQFSNRIICMGVSNNGHYVASHESSGGDPMALILEGKKRPLIIKMYEIPSGKLSKVLNDQTGRWDLIIDKLIFSSDDKYLIALKNEDIVLFDLSKKQPDKDPLVLKRKASGGGGSDVQITPDNKYLIEGYNWGWLYISKFPSGELVHAFKRDSNYGGTATYTVSADGKYIAFYPWGSPVQVCTIPEGERLYEFNLASKDDPTNRAYLFFTKEKNELLIVYRNTMYWCDFKEGILKRSITDEKMNGAGEFSINSEGTILAGINKQGVSFWDAKTGGFLANAPQNLGQKDVHQSVTFSSGDRYTAIASTVLGWPSHTQLKFFDRDALDLEKMLLFLRSKSGQPSKKSKL